MMLCLIFPLVLVISSGLSVQADVIGFANQTLNVKLPSPLSDFGIALNEGLAHVYLAGGCNSETGDEFVADFGEFACLSLSNQLVTFDLNSETVIASVDMPAPRYRHAAVFADQRLWLVGGRDVEDLLIGTVDVSADNIIIFYQYVAGFLIHCNTITGL